MITLNKDQKAAKKAIVQWVKDGGEKPFTLSGSAGTGKTTLMSHVMTRIAPDKFIYLAPTHRAVAVMKGKLQPSGLDGRCFTTAKGTNRILAKDDIKPYLTRKSSPNALLKDPALVVIDEASWVDDKTWKILLEESKVYSVRLLFVGDPYQLPPPAAKATWPMFEKSKARVFELTEVVRQSQDSPIIGNALDLRSAIKRKSAPKFFPKPGTDAHGRGVVLIEPEDVISSLVDAAKKNTNICLFAWRNATIMAWSAEIRDALYGAKPGSYWVPGERVTNLRWTTGPGKTYMYSHQQSTVHSIGKDGVHKKYGLAYRSIALRPDGTTNLFPAKEILDSEALKEQLDEIANQAFSVGQSDPRWGMHWRRWHKLREEFVELSSAFVSTVHSAQGQTLDAVWIDLDDIHLHHVKNDVNRMVYVAMTRASNTAYVAGENLTLMEAM